MKVEFEINANGDVTILNQDQETDIMVNKKTLPFVIEVTGYLPDFEEEMLPEDEEI